jgi:hypothetical protein
VDPEDHRLNAEDTIENEQRSAAIRHAILALVDDNQQSRDLVEGIMERF